MTTMTQPLPRSSSALILRDDQPLDLRGRRVHFVGIGGCGMSGLARLVQQQGAHCTGSDLAESAAVAALRRAGFPVVLEQTAAAVPDDCELVVISAAIHAEHPELSEAGRRGIPVLKYAQLLGKLMLGRVGVAVAGTHGKSSTTSMLAHVLIQSGLDPSIIVGAHCQQIGGGSRTGRHGTPELPGILVAEACEYDRSFHNFHPTHGIILNVEADHLDLYKNLDEIVESFTVFARKIAGAQGGGSLLIQHEMPQRLAICADLACNVETIGFAPQADWRVHCNGGNTVRLYHQGREVASWVSPLPGEHMAYNAAAAAVTAHRLGAAWDRITPALESFAGLDRRMQKLGTIRSASHLPGEAPADVLIIDDYGHHPTEIDTTLRALRRHYQPKRLICVFQPHQHSRTRFFMNEFAASFSEADVVIVPHIFFSRDSEAERRAVTAGDLVDRLRGRDVHALHLYPFAAIVEYLRHSARPGDLIVTMGAGDVWKIARDLLA
jgi:UDP-N-acetylmuramate--alanine ligase